MPLERIQLVGGLYSPRPALLHEPTKKLIDVEDRGVLAAASYLEDILTCPAKTGQGRWVTLLSLIQEFHAGSDGRVVYAGVAGLDRSSSLMTPHPDPPPLRRPLRWRMKMTPCPNTRVRSLA